LRRAINKKVDLLVVENVVNRNKRNVAFLTKLFSEGIKVMTLVLVSTSTLDNWDLIFSNMADQIRCIHRAVENGWNGSIFLIKIA
jgi:hypothetical protein